MERPLPRPGVDEVLVKIKMAGICSTDLEIMKGYLPFEGILGHEFVGTVVQGSEKECREEGLEKLIGRRVVASINLPCYSCAACKKGLYNHCFKIKTLGMRDKDGAFAEYLIIKQENLYLVPETLDDREAVFVEPIAAAVEIAEKIHIKPTARVLILGDGKLGLITAMVLMALGLDVGIIGRHADKLKVLDGQDIRTYLPEEFEGMADILVDCSGNSSGLKMAMDMVRPEGKVVLKTTVADSQAFNLSSVAVNEISIIGSRCGPFDPALRLLKRNDLPLNRMIDSVYKLEDGVQAMERAAQQGVLKVLLDME